MSDESGVARAESVIALGPRFVDATDPLNATWRAALADTSSLSPAGLSLAMTHLETSQSVAERAAFHARVRPASRAHVVLGGNVCTAALRAIALAVAASPRVYVKASRRDDALARLLVAELTASSRFEGEISLVGAIAPTDGDSVFAYGSDETLATIRRSLPSGVAFFGHGHGFGIGWIGDTERTTFDAEALARDIVVFDQAGCLSPRVVFVDGTAREVTDVAERLSMALTRAEERVPRGKIDVASAAIYLRAMRSIGGLVEGEGFTLGLDLEPEALTIPPPARMLHLVRADAAHALSLLTPAARFVTTVARVDDWKSAALRERFERLCPGARMTRFGAMQRPPLDGPVDLRAD